MLPDVANLPEAVDINNLDLMQEAVVVDGQVNSEEFFMPALPDDGEHRAVVRLGDRGIKADRQKDKKGDKTGAAYLNVHLVVKLLDDAGNETLTVFDNPTSIVMQSAGTSKLHAILDICGFQAPGRTTLADLKALTEQALAQNPVVKVVTQWEAQNKASSAEVAGKANCKIGEYYTVLKGQKRFPQDSQTGKFSAEVQDPYSGEQIRANVRIIRYAKV